MDALRYGVASRPIMEGKVIPTTQMPDVLPATVARIKQADFDPAFIGSAKDETDHEFHLGEEW